MSYCYPPLVYARAVQVHRLLTHLPVAATVVCGEDPAAPRDATMALTGGPARPEVVRLGSPGHTPWAVGPLSFVDRSIPDEQRGWNLRAVRHPLLRELRPEVLVTFGMPMSDHLFGLALHRRTGVPWVAHFSDPWADNPYRAFHPVSHWWNRRQEAAVVAAAHRVVFTSEETVDLVMAKYPAAWRAKARVLPHAFDPVGYEGQPPGNHYVLRSVGALYGQRSPQPLLAALEALANERPTLLDGVRVELVGELKGFDGLLDRYPKAAAVVHLAGMVDYAESLRRMATAHCLLAIDAPADRSVFFPSKLADYFGAGRFVLALSPQGTTKRLVQNAGGLVADPSDGGAVRAALEQVLTGRPAALGNPQAAARFAADNVAEEMMMLLREVTG